MTREKKLKMQAAFLRKVGPNAATFKAMMDTLPDVAFYMKDAQGRIMALNKRNCDFCNIPDDIEAIGQRSDNLFPHVLADKYLARDEEVRETGRPIVAKYGGQFNSDRTNDMHVSSVYPLRDRRGLIIGTTCIYFKTQVIDSPNWHGRLKPATDYIAEHYAEQITLSHLAKLVGTSTMNFRRQFTRTLDISPGHYITTVRLNAARKLLETTNKLLSEIAAETGFWDQSHFTKQFRRERGMTPGEYRRRHRHE